MTQTDTGIDLEAINRDNAHHIHPWTDFAARATTPPEVIVSGKGPYIETASGTRLLDANGGGLSAVTLGYGNTEIADAIADQVRQLQFYSHFGQFTAPPAAELSAALARLAPAHINHAHFGTSGSIANETAIRLIHYYFNQIGKPDKKDVIALTRGYHGSTLLSASLTGIDFFRLGFDVLSERIHHLPDPNPYHRPAGSTVEEFCDAQIDGLRAKIEEVGPDRVACMIAEPIMAVGGVITPPPGYLRRAQAVCREYGVMFVTDEVVTGFGRLGEYFCAEPVFGARPDVITLRQGPHLRLPAPVGDARVRRDPRRDQRAPGARWPAHPRLHVLGPSRGVRRGPEGHRDHGARRHLRPRPRSRALLRGAAGDAGRHPDGGRHPRQPHDPRGRAGHRPGDAGSPSTTRWTSASGSLATPRPGVP